MALNTAQKTKQALSESQKKWGAEAIKAGFTVFPNTLLSKQHALGLDCFDIVIILQIHKHWWRAEKKPYPSQVQVAKSMNTDLSTVKRHLKRLRDLGFISWTSQKNSQGGQAANVYDFSGLVEKVRQFALEELTEREKKTDERKERQARKRPRVGKPALKVVKQ